MTSFNPESSTMVFFRRIGLERIAWALRRLHCPVDTEALVLEVGSGGNPYPRSDVLFDAYETTRERHWEPLTVDRPTVMGFAENLPFRDKSFDFVIASHVLEHSAHPERFLGELQRVAKGGYIESPDAFFERVIPYKDHRLEIAFDNGKLVITKKERWLRDPDIVQLFERKFKTIIGEKLISRRPFAFHNRYYWSEKIDFIVTNPDVDSAWKAVQDETGGEGIRRTNWRRLVMQYARRRREQRTRGRSLDLRNVLACPTCRSEHLIFSDSDIRCSACNAAYEMKKGIPLLYPRATNEGRNASR